MDALTLMQACGMETGEQLRVLERKIERMECTQVERVYMQFRLLSVDARRLFLGQGARGNEKPSVAVDDIGGCGNVS